MMRRTLFVLWLLLLSFALSYAQDSPYKVVFDLTSKDSLDQKAVMRWIREISTSDPEAELEVVMYGKGFELVMPERSWFMTDVNNAVKNPHVSFKVCEVALKNNKVEKSQIVKGAQTVPDGIYEIVSKQHQGWGYIKVGH